MKLYKLTGADGYTRRGERNQCLWGEGVSHSGTGEGDLCGPGYVHAYEHPLLAVLFNPVHANFDNPILWLAEGKPAKRDGEMKLGCKTLKTVRRLELPQVTTEYLVTCAIKWALHTNKNTAFAKWANAWLDGSDRTESSAAEAAWAANAAWAAARAADAAWAAAKAADAAWAADAAARAADPFILRIAVETADAMGIMYDLG